MFAPETIVDLDGVCQSIAEHALDYGITPELIVERLTAGWSTRRAITEPMTVSKGEKLPKHQTHNPAAHPRRNASYLTHDGRTQTIREWAAETGVKRTTILARLKKGWTVARALTEPAGAYFRDLNRGMSKAAASARRRKPEGWRVVDDFCEQPWDRRGSYAHDRAKTSFPQPESKPA